MGLSTKCPITPYRNSWADQMRRRRIEALLTDFDGIDDHTSVANIREQIRLFGVDRVRSL
jgi:hypothetical protein